MPKIQEDKIQGDKLFDAIKKYALKKEDLEGVNVNTKDTETGASLLQFAAGTGNKEIVTALLTKGADVNSLDLEGSSALVDASRNGHANIVGELLKKGADISKGRNHDGETCLSYAVGKNNLKVLGNIFLYAEKKNLRAAIGGLDETTKATLITQTKEFAKELLEQNIPANDELAKKIIRVFPDQDRKNFKEVIENALMEKSTYDEYLAKTWGVSVEDLHQPAPDPEQIWAPKSPMQTKPDIRRENLEDVFVEKSRGNKLMASVSNLSNGTSKEGDNSAALEAAIKKIEEAREIAAAKVSEAREIAAAKVSEAREAAAAKVRDQETKLKNFAFIKQGVQEYAKAVQAEEARLKKVAEVTKVREEAKAKEEGKAATKIQSLSRGFAGRLEASEAREKAALEAAKAKLSNQKAAQVLGFDAQKLSDPKVEQVLGFDAQQIKEVVSDQKAAQLFGVDPTKIPEAKRETKREAKKLSSSTSLVSRAASSVSQAAAYVKSSASIAANSASASISSVVKEIRQRLNITTPLSNTSRAQHRQAEKVLKNKDEHSI